jgi:hypothetical protein
MGSDASIGSGLRRAALAEVVETPIQKNDTEGAEEAIQALRADVEVDATRE